MASALTVLEKENADGTKTEKKESEDKSVEAKGLVLNSDTQTYWIDEKQAFTFATDDHYRLSAKIEITKNPEVNGIYNISRHVYTPEEEQYIITTQLRYNNGQYFPELVLEKRMQEGIKTKKYSTNEAYKDRQYNLVYYVDIKNFDNNEIEVALNINDKTLYNGDGLQANYTNRDFDAYLPDTNKLNDNVSSDFAYIMYQFGYKYNKYQQDFTMQSAYARPVSASKEVQMNHSVAQTRASIVTMVYNNLVGDKRYELSNHLGNVLEVISDRKLLNIDRGVPVLAPQYNNNESTAPFNKTTQLYKLSVQGEWLVVNNEPGIEKEGAYAPVDLITGHIYQISFVIENGHDGPIEVAVIDDNNDLVFSKVFEGENGFLSYNFQNEAPTGTYNLIFRTYEGGGEYYLKNINLIDVTNVNANQVFGNPAEMAIFVPNVMSYNDYYPFGMLMPTRHESSDGYRYGFNGKENDNELKGTGNSVDFGARMYDPRLGRWLKLDALKSVYVSLSPYVFAANSPIKLLDVDGNILRDKDGNIIVNSSGNNRTSATPIKIINTKSNTFTAETLVRTYEDVTIYADDGTPIQALRLVEQHMRTGTYNKDGKLISLNNDKTNVNSSIDAVADCHGFTFASNNLWINNGSVKTILEHDDYERKLNKEQASVVIFRKDKKIVHSSKVNKDGTYSSNAGITKTKYNISLKEAVGGLTNINDKKNIEFVNKRKPDKQVDAKNIGNVVNGLRTLSHEDAIKFSILVTPLQDVVNEALNKGRKKELIKVKDNIPTK